MRKTWKIFWGVAFVLVALFLILDAIGVLSPFASAVGEISMIALVLGLVLLAFIVASLVRGRIPQICFPLAFLFMLFEDNIAFLCYGKEENIIDNWLVLVIALLLNIGFTILFSKVGRRTKCHGFGFTNTSGKHVDNSFSSATVYVDCNDFSRRFIENSFGSCTVHFTDPEAYKGEGTLVIENSFGSVQINVPATWEVTADIENSFGSYNIPRKADQGGPVLYIKGESSFGSINIKYI